MAAYQLTSAHLSYARAAYGDPGLVANLTRLVADAHSVIYGSRTRSLATTPGVNDTRDPAAASTSAWSDANPSSGANTARTPAEP